MLPYAELGRALTMRSSVSQLHDQGMNMQTTSTVLRQLTRVNGRLEQGMCKESVVF